MGDCEGYAEAEVRELGSKNPASAIERIDFYCRINLGHPLKINPHCKEGIDLCIKLESDGYIKLVVFKCHGSRAAGCSHVFPVMTVAESGEE